jgi:hypothetical protein
MCLLPLTCETKFHIRKKPTNQIIYNFTCFNLHVFWTADANTKYSEQHGSKHFPNLVYKGFITNFNTKLLSYTQ